MPKDSKEKAEIKVTDKRIFTAEGDIREEFRDDIHPSDRAPAPTPAPEPPPAAEPARPDPTPQQQPERRAEGSDSVPPPETGERRRTIAEKGESPGTPFSNFIQSLVMQAYMMLGMLRNPYQPQAKPDVAGARDLIDILSLLREKTSGNLTFEEDEFLSTHLSQLKLAYVQMTKNLS